MATLTLTAMWVNLVSTGAAVSAQSAPGKDVTYANQGEVRAYAGGRQRAFTRAGEAGRVGFTLLLVSAAQVTTLRGWKGETVQVRDTRGQRWYGVLFDVAIKEVPSAAAQWTATTTLHLVTYVDGV